MTRASKPSFDAKVLLIALAGGAPAVVATIALLVTQDVAPKITWTVGVVVVLAWLLVPLALRDRITGRLHTLASVIEAFREGDYSVRGRHTDEDGALGSAMRELNSLGDALRDHRLGAMEASSLLEKVMASIDVAVIAVDERGIIRLVNAAAERLVSRPASDLVGSSAGDVGLDELLSGDAPRLVTARFAGEPGPFELRRSAFRLAGRPHELLVLADLHRALREQEREAWQRLVRVLGHEINTSLAPIQSIGQSILDLVRRDPRPDDWEDDLESGLEVVSRRAGGLARFMSAYAKLARLPAPRRRPLAVRAWVARVAALDQRLSVAVSEGEALTIDADGDQLDQLLINLVKNAVDAALETGGGARVGWDVERGWLEVRIEDDGKGIADTANLFVPFFTTKPDGSGIGLALARQIAEAHGGTVSLEPKPSGEGAVARVRLPVTGT